MDIFEYSRQKELKKNGPLADRMRPTIIEEVVGQEHIIGPGKLLRRCIETDKLSSIIFYGPPGTGKTTLAAVIANSTKAHFEQLSAVTSGVKDIRRIIKEAKERLGMYSQKTVLFIDEIHRFNKSQQDALLPYVENGTVILIGATTETPSFEINSALLSRSTIFKLEPLKPKHLKTILLKAIKDKKQGLGNMPLVVSNDAIEHFIHSSGGDARKALNAVELAALTAKPNSEGKIYITLEIAKQSTQTKNVVYDKNGSNHYDIVSAFIKSMRGSDPDAAVYYLAKMLTAGEDPKFIARRILIHAAEDVGMADPNAILIAHAAVKASEFLGMPEVRIPLAEAAIYIALAPKSNSVLEAIDKAMDTVKTEYSAYPQPHLRDAHYPGAKDLGHGIGYKYPHNFGGYVKQQYLPDEHLNKKFYIPKESDEKKRYKQILDKQL